MSKEESMRRHPSSPDEEAWDEAAYQEQESWREPPEVEPDHIRKQRFRIRNGRCPLDKCGAKLPPTWPGHDTVICRSCGFTVEVRV